MCIIAAKPAGTKMPATTTIENMWYRNHDGAGFMYAHGGTVHIEKGFMKLDDFKKALERVQEKVNLNATSVVMHFRIATHGGVMPANTHPFPVTSSISMLQKLKCTTSLGVAHNGIISSVNPRKGISDTMEYIASQLAPLYKGVPTFYENPNLMEMVSNAIAGAGMPTTPSATLMCRMSSATPASCAPSGTTRTRTQLTGRASSSTCSRTSSPSMERASCTSTCTAATDSCRSRGDVRTMPTERPSPPRRTTTTTTSASRRCTRRQARSTKSPRSRWTRRKRNLKSSCCRNPRLQRQRCIRKTLGYQPLLRRDAAESGRRNPDFRRLDYERQSSFFSRLRSYLPALQIRLSNTETTIKLLNFC